jgi:hypothetical protein
VPPRLSQCRRQQPAGRTAAGTAAVGRGRAVRAQAAQQGIKTGTVTALDVPGQIQQGLALGVLTEAESQLLLDYDAQVMHIVNVDDFAPTDLGTHPYPQE